MANIKNVKFLRNGKLYADHDAAFEALSGMTGLQDGVAVLARYATDDDDVKTLVGFSYSGESGTSMTILDVEGASADVEALRQEINAKLGTGVTSGNTATAQFAALSGTSADGSGVTSVWGAKAYAKDYTDEQIGNLEYTGVTTGTGVYVTNVTEADGVVAATTATLPSVADTAVAKKFVTSVSEDKGQISVSRGEITSTDKTITLTNGNDGGIDFSVNIDNDTLQKDENGVISVTSSALVQYEGDGDTIQIGAVSEGVRTVSSPLTIEKVTTGLSEEVKEEYHLVGASGNTIGDPVKIYKDSHIVSISYISDPADAHYQNLEYVYVNASGATSTTYVDMSMLVLEAEFASGLTITDHIARGVVDPTSETFLTVGADGFKLSGVQDAIDGAINGLDVTGDTAVAGEYVAAIEETNGVVAVKTRANVSEAVLNNYTKGSDATAVTSADTVNGAISKLENQIDKAKAAATTAVEADAANTHVTVSAATDPTTSAVTYTIHEDDIASASDLTDEITARKAVDGQSGQTYSANTGTNYISGATSLNNADVLLDAQVKLNADNIATNADNILKNKVYAGNGISVTGGLSTESGTTVTAVAKSQDPVIEVTSGGIGIKDNAVWDCGTYDDDNE